MVIEANQLLDRSLKNGIARGVSEDDRAVYEAPYAQPGARRPILQWTREIGSAGHHAPEDRPGEIADAISSFLTRHSL